MLLVHHFYWNRYVSGLLVCLSMKTRPPLDILVWCHLPSWAIWSPSLRPQFSPARLSGLRTRDNYQKVSIRISTSISILNLQFVIKRKSTCSTCILVTGLSPDLCPSRLYIITIWRCFNWNLEMGVLHFQERSKPLNGTWIPWVPLHFTWFSLRMQKKLRVSDIFHHHLPHPIGGWDQN